MDIEKFVLLEASIARLLEAFVQLQEENRRLTLSIAQLEQTVLMQREDLERMEHVREEMQQLRTTMQVLQHEREFFQKKLVEMLSTIEQLEELSNLDKNPG